MKSPMSSYGSHVEVEEHCSGLSISVPALGDSTCAASQGIAEEFLRPLDGFLLLALEPLFS